MIKACLFLKKKACLLNSPTVPFLWIIIDLCLSRGFKSKLISLFIVVQLICLWLARQILQQSGNDSSPIKFRWHIYALRYDALP